MYKIQFTKNANKKLKNLPTNLRKRIKEKLQELAKNPYGYNLNAKKLVGRNGYRLRVGDWRIIYEIHDQEVIILVLEINTRGGIYK